MSGGYWGYEQHNIKAIADDVHDMIMTNDGTYSDETLLKFKNAEYYMRMAFIYADAIDYLLSDDHSEKSFHEVLDYQIKQYDEAFRNKLKETK
jgi:hypothetical protein